MVTWRSLSHPRGDVKDIVYVVYFRSADDDVTSCGDWSMNGSVNVASTADHLSSLVSGLCPDTEFSFTVISWTVVFSCFMEA